MVPSPWGPPGAAPHVHPPGRSWCLKPNCLRDPRHTCYGTGTPPAPHPGPGGGGGRVPSAAPEGAALRSAQSSSSSFAVTVGTLSRARKQSTKKLMMER